MLIEIGVMYLFVIYFNLKNELTSVRAIHVLGIKYHSMITLLVSLMKEKKRPKVFLVSCLTLTPAYV